MDENQEEIDPENVIANGWLVCLPAGTNDTSQIQGVRSGVGGFHALWSE